MSGGRGRKLSFEKLDLLPPCKLSEFSLPLSLNIHKKTIEQHFHPGSTGLSSLTLIKVFAEVFLNSLHLILRSKTKGFGTSWGYKGRKGLIYFTKAKGWESWELFMNHIINRRYEVWIKTKKYKAVVGLFYKIISISVGVLISIGNGSFGTKPTKFNLSYPKVWRAG